MASKLPFCHIPPKVLSLYTQGRVQFYIVVYHFNTGVIVPHVVDRFQIDLELSIASDFTERKTYYGLQNLTQFDMSFKIAGQCSDNYYGPQCDVFCSEVEGQFTCDSEGNTVCVNSNLNPETNCTECVPGRDPSIHQLHRVSSWQRPLHRLCVMPPRDVPDE